MTAIDDEVKSRELIITKERFENLQSTLLSKSTKAKFKAFLSLGKRKEPIYEEVVEVFNKIFDPVIETMLRDEVFFGDYMPELQRYL